jgi:hypothetical protein
MTAVVKKAIGLSLLPILQYPITAVAVASIAWLHLDCELRAEIDQNLEMRVKGEPHVGIALSVSEGIPGEPAKSKILGYWIQSLAGAMAEAFLTRG